MSSAPKFIPHYTIEDYQHWEGDWELIDGIAIAMTPSPFGHHERIISRQSFEIQKELREENCGCEIYTNLDWIVNISTVIRPDLMVVYGAQPDKHLETPPNLMVEVLSASTRDSNLTAKLQIAVDNNVSNYIVIDPDKRNVQQLIDGSFEQSHTNEIAIRLDNRCTVYIAPTVLFDQ